MGGRGPHQSNRPFTGARMQEVDEPVAIDGLTPSSDAKEGRYRVRRVRRLQTLAIETSCDDTSVAILSLVRTRPGQWETNVLFHQTITAPSQGYTGIHPLVALRSHRTHLSSLIQRAMKHIKPQIVRDSGDGDPNERDGWLEATRETLDSRPDFVTVTRGPGMRSNLSVGLDTAKGLALAWQVPLLGVHHMQAHALTPRLCNALGMNINALDQKVVHLGGKNRHPARTNGQFDIPRIQPEFPFLTLLVSGGHTMLIKSNGLNNHSVIAESCDIAIGDCLDKAARTILSGDLLTAPYGRALEQFAFPEPSSDGSHHDRELGCIYNYVPPACRKEELERKQSSWNWAFTPPFAMGNANKTSKRMAYSFSGLQSSVERFMAYRTDEHGVPSSVARPSESVSSEERRDMAREVQRVAFEHVASRLLLYLASIPQKEAEHITTIVVSGGVASNKYLRYVMRSMLDARGYRSMNLEFPPVHLCTDNALMIAWAGLEMFDAGYESEFGIEPIRKWSMDPTAADGGVVGVAGWLRSPSMRA